MKNAPAIKIENLHKTFGSNKILKGISLAVNQGEDLVILGRSGTGKSVTIKCMVGLIEADKGKIEVFGTDITKLNKKELNAIGNNFNQAVHKLHLLDKIPEFRVWISHYRAV